LTVGFLVDALNEGYQWEVLQGALEAVRDCGAKLLCFQGGAFHAADAARDGGSPSAPSSSGGHDRGTSPIPPRPAG
jgi:hypothetical protein